MSAKNELKLDGKCSFKYLQAALALFTLKWERETGRKAQDFRLIIMGDGSYTVEDDMGKERLSGQAENCL